MIAITVNGKPREIDAEMELPAFLRAFDINPRLVAVAINGDVIPKAEYAAARVRAGDVLEIVRMVGGGCSLEAGSGMREAGRAQSCPDIARASASTGL